MKAFDEKAFRLKRIMNHCLNVDSLIYESTSEQELGSLGILLFIQSLRILTAVFGPDKVKERIAEMIDERTSKPNHPRGWNSDRQEWDASAFFNKDDPNVRKK